MSGIDGCDYEPYVKAAALKVILENMKANDEKFKEIKAQTRVELSITTQTQQEENLNKKKSDRLLDLIA